jgi:hypothetical protein
MADEDEDDEFTVQTAQELYSAYSDFCRTTGERAKSKTKFETDIRDHIVKIRKSSGMCYDLTTITM